MNSIPPVQDVTSAHHAALVQHYHRSHTEAIKSFGMHGFELEMEALLEEYRARVDYGAMASCLLKPALYVLQRVNSKDGCSLPPQPKRPAATANNTDGTTEDGGSENSPTTTSSSSEDDLVFPR